MRRWCVWLVVVVLLFGAVGVAGTFSGEIRSRFYHYPGGMSLINTDLHIEIEYTVSAWTFGLRSEFHTSSFGDLAVDVEGSIGAVDLYSIAFFVPSVHAPVPFTGWNSIATMSLGGASLYVISAVSNQDYWNSDLPFPWSGYLPGELGIGLRVGGWGTAGSIAVYAESRFNMENRYYAGPLLYWAYGFDELMLDVRELVWEFEEYTDVDWIGPDDFMFPQTPRARSRGPDSTSSWLRRSPATTSSSSRRSTASTVSFNGRP